MRSKVTGKASLDICARIRSIRKVKRTFTLALAPAPRYTPLNYPRQIQNRVTSYMCIR